MWEIQRENGGFGVFLEIDHVFYVIFGHNVEITWLKYVDIYAELGLLIHVRIFHFVDYEVVFEMAILQNVPQNESELD